MKGLEILNPPPLYLEFGQTKLQALRAGEGLELPLERESNGRLTPASIERTATGLRNFVRRRLWQPRQRAWCAIGARGVSLRRLTLPPSAPEELPQLVRLQIESEFPLPPDELAWGFRRLATPAPATGIGGLSSAEVLVVAVKKEVVADYAAILAPSELDGVFTLGGLARSCLCPGADGSFALLDIGRSQSELMCFADGAPVSVRLLPWGGDHLTHSIQTALGVGPDEAEQAKLAFDRRSVGDVETSAKISAALHEECAVLARCVKGHWQGPRLFLSGRTSRLQSLVPSLAEKLGGATVCQPLEVTPGAGRSAAVLGLQCANAPGEMGTTPLIELNGHQTDVRTPRPEQWKRFGVAGGLLALALLFPYLEALLLKPHLMKRIAAAKAVQSKLAVIDHELAFLDYIKQNEPPYLEAMTVIANASPPGARLESFTINRRGELSIRAVMVAPQAADFRSKLIDSGFFNTLVVDEQAPTPDRQRVAIRLSGQWRPANGRPPTPVELARPEPKPVTQGPSRARPSGGVGAPVVTNRTTNAAVAAKATNATVLSHTQ